jgi:hypothetical protein
MYKGKKSVWEDDEKGNPVKKLELGSSVVEFRVFREPVMHIDWWYDRKKSGGSYSYKDENGMKELVDRVARKLEREPLPVNIKRVVDIFSKEDKAQQQRDGIFYWKQKESTGLSVLADGFVNHHNGETRSRHITESLNVAVEGKESDIEIRHLGRSFALDIYKDGVSSYAVYDQKNFEQGVPSLIKEAVQKAVREETWEAVTAHDLLKIVDKTVSQNRKLRGLTCIKHDECGEGGFFGLAGNSPKVKNMPFDSAGNSKFSYTNGAGNTRYVLEAFDDKSKKFDIFHMTENFREKDAEEFLRQWKTGRQRKDAENTAANNKTGQTQTHIKR